MRGLMMILTAALIISQAVCFPARKAAGPAVERSPLFGGVPAPEPSPFNPFNPNITVGVISPILPGDVLIS